MSLRIYPSTIGSVFYGAVFARRAVCSAGRPRNTCTSGMARCSVCQMKISRPRYLTVSTTLFFSPLLFPYSSDLSSPAILPSHSFSPPASPTSVFVLSTLNSSFSPFSSPPPPYGPRPSSHFSFCRSTSSSYAVSNKLII